MNRRSRLPQNFIYCFLIVTVTLILIHARGTASEKSLMESVTELEEKVRTLKTENDILAHEIEQLRRTVERMMAQGNSAQEKMKGIAKVTRVLEGRPKKNDMMI